MLSLRAPMALLGLVAWSWPLAVHLVRRRTGAPIVFGALRWLPVRTAPKQRRRWHERVLLALRLSVITAAVLLLAGPQWVPAANSSALPRTQRPADHIPGPDDWVLLAPGVPPAAARAVVAAPNAQWRWLAPGFQRLTGVETLPRAAIFANGIANGTANATANGIANATANRIANGTANATANRIANGTANGISTGMATGTPKDPANGATDDTTDAAAHSGASLLREADASLSPGVGLTVVLPTPWTGADAERLRLWHAVDWRPMPTTGVASAPQAARPLHIVLRPARGAEAELPAARALLAAWTAIGASVGTEAGPGAALPAASTNTVVLQLGGRDAALTAWVTAGGTALVTQLPCPDGDPALRAADGHTVWTTQPLGAGRLICLATPLTVAATPSLRDASLPARLLALTTLSATASGSAGPAAAVDVDADAVAPLVAALPPASRFARPLDGWCSVALALLVLTERVRATRGARR